jgi:hypothetical protein
MNKLLAAAAAIGGLMSVAACSSHTDSAGAAYRSGTSTPPSAADDFRFNSNASSPAGPARANGSGRINEGGNGGGGGM